MTHDEKAKLKLEVENCTPKEASELLAMHQSKEEEEEEELQRSPLHSGKIPFLVQLFKA